MTEPMVDALLAAGWTEVGRGRGCVRLSWPVGSDSLMVPTDPEAPEHNMSLNAVIEELVQADRRGQHARAALDRLTAAGVIQ